MNGDRTAGEGCRNVAGPAADRPPAGGPASLAEEFLIRAILEDTAGETGEQFFAALVRNLSRALAVAGAWVTWRRSGP